MYETPSQADLARNLSTRVHAARHLAKAETARIISECAARGIASSTVCLGLVGNRIDELHAEAIEQAMFVVRDFIDRMAKPSSQVGPWARPHLERLGIELLTVIPAANFPQHQQRMRQQYAQVFQQRLDGALRDIQIGFIGGRGITTESKNSQSKALRLLKGIYDESRDGDAPVFVNQLAAITGLSESEAQAAWRYLKDKGLIEIFNLPYTARVNARGIDAIEDAQSRPDEPIEAFPAVTYNIVNNTTTIGTAINSQFQQAGSHSNQNLVTTYNGQDRADLVRLVNEVRSHLHELQLDASANRKAVAQLATLQAQLGDEPDPVIVRQAGRTLRNITEGAIASLAATAIQPAVWAWVAEAMVRFS